MQSRLRIGVHTSIAKLLEDAAHTAALAGANTFQTFSASPRQWRAVPRSASEIALLHPACERHDLYPLVIHDNYLIYLASCSEPLRAQSSHCHSSGYGVASAAGVKKTVAEIDRILGIDNVKVIHANDSKKPLGSHLHRHEHIGHGYIGEEGFRRILNHPKLRNKAFILETPNDEEGDERRNIETLKNLCRKSSTTSIR